jgi:hypothetical protein
MKFFISAIAAMLFTTLSYAQQTASTQDPAAVGNAFFKSLLDEDSKTLGTLISSDFSLLSFDGNVVDGDLLVQAVGGGYVVVETATVSDTRTRQYNNDSAVMTGQWKAKGNVQGQAFDNNVAFSVVCAKQGDAWKIVNVQFTPVR